MDSSAEIRPVIGVARVVSEWRDYNGHVNYAAYAVAADPVIDDVYAAAGLDAAYRASTGFSYYAVECRFIYLREIRDGTAIEIHGRLIDFDSKRAHIFLELYDRDLDRLSAVAHLISAHVDPALGRSVEFPDFILDKLTALKAAHARLPEPEQFDDTVVLRRRLRRARAAAP